MTLPTWDWDWAMPKARTLPWRVTARAMRDELGHERSYALKHRDRDISLGRTTAEAVERDTDIIGTLLQRLDPDGDTIDLAACGSTWTQRVDWARRALTQKRRGYARLVEGGSMTAATARERLDAMQGVHWWLFARLGTADEAVMRAMIPDDETIRTSADLPEGSCGARFGAPARRWLTTHATERDWLRVRTAFFRVAFRQWFARGDALIAAHEAATGNSQNRAQREEAA
ncbi:hypothetical protein ACSMXM_01205 [Pacificimonas sp. ICDLI1SI03]